MMWKADICHVTGIKDNIKHIVAEHLGLFF